MIGNGATAILLQGQTREGSLGFNHPDQHSLPVATMVSAIQSSKSIIVLSPGFRYPQPTTSLFRETTTPAHKPNRASRSVRKRPARGPLARWSIRRRSAVSPTRPSAGRGRRTARALHSRRATARRHICRQFERVQVHPLRAAAVAHRPFAPRIINEDAAHRFGGRGEKNARDYPTPVERHRPVAARPRAPARWLARSGRVTRAPASARPTGATLRKRAGAVHRQRARRPAPAAEGLTVSSVTE